MSWISVGAFLTTGLLGMLTLSVSPRSVGRVSFAATMLLLALESSLALLSSYAQTPQGAVAFQQWRFGVMALLPGVWLLFSLRYARNRSHPLLSAWSVVVMLAFLVPVTLLVLPGQPVWSGAFVQPRSETVFTLGRRAVYLHGFLLFMSLLVLGNLEQTFRAATGTMRWRVKFLLLGAGLILLARVYTSGFAVIEHSWPYSHDLVRAIALIVAGGLILWSLARMGLSQAEVYPSRKVILGAASTTLVAAYLFLVAALARAVSMQEGQGAMSLAALVILAGVVLLGLTLMSDRMRHRAILFFSRHFNRPLYDYRMIWQTFRERVAPVNSEHAYCRVSADFLSQTLQALSVTIWQLDTRRSLSFGGSTVLTAESAKALLSNHPLPHELLDTLVEQEGVLDLDDPESSWSDARGRLFASQFQNAGGHRLCVPLRAGDGLVGLLLIGDRVGARAYSAEELDLLFTLAEEISRGLLGLRNAGQLLVARELQAFQAMSAFVVHDLKNTASTLSLTLQNFRKHHDNPAFRDDALQSVSGCVSHLKEVINTLGVLRQDLHIRPVECELNALVHETCVDLGGEQSFPVTCQLVPIPRVTVDPAQIKKVLVNLLLNARDAVGPGGHVEVRTSMRDARKVEISVHDDGCGMDEEFVRTKLFRPFQSTKRKGLGIGLFHSRMILEAHHGEIEVESRPGEGTVFRVLLLSKPARS